MHPKFEYVFYELTPGRVLGIDSFGASGKAADLFRHFGLTAAHLQRSIVELLGH